MDDLIKVASKLRDAFEHNPGHSDLDNEQPIHISTTLGTWRELSYILGQIERAHRTPPEVAGNDAKDAARYRWLCKQNNFLVYIENDAGEQTKVRLRCGAPLDSWLDDRLNEEADKALPQSSSPE